MGFNSGFKGLIVLNSLQSFPWNILNLCVGGSWWLSLLLMLGWWASFSFCYGGYILALFLVVPFHSLWMWCLCCSLLSGRNLRAWPVLWTGLVIVSVVCGWEHCIFSAFVFSVWFLLYFGYTASFFPKSLPRLSVSGIIVNLDIVFSCIEILSPLWFLQSVLSLVWILWQGSALVSLSLHNLGWDFFGGIVGWSKC